MNFKPLKLMSLIFILGLLVIPFIYWPKAPVPYEVPRVWFFNRWVEVLGLTGLLFSPQLLKRKILDNKLIVYVITFLLVVFISSYFGENFSKSFWGNYYRGDGLFTLIHLIILLLITSLFVNQKLLKKIILVISISSFLISSWTIIDAFSLYILKNPLINNLEGVVSISFGNPNFLAGYLLVTLPFSLYFFKKNKRVVLVVIATQITTIILTQSWAAVFGIIIFFAGWLAISSKQIRWKYLFILILLFITSLIVFLNQKEKEQIPHRLIAESRQRIFTKGIKAFSNKPMLGWGWANFDHAFESIDWPIKIYDDIYVDKAHSSILEVLTTTGIVGLIIYSAIIIKTISNLYYKKNKVFKYLLLSFVLITLHMQTNIVSITEEMLFWMIVGSSVVTSWISTLQQ